MDVVGGYKRNPCFLVQSGKSIDDLFLPSQTVILYFEIEISSAEESVHFDSVVSCFFEISRKYHLRNVSRKAGGEAYKPFAVRAQKLHIYARLHIKSFREGF